MCDNRTYCVCCVLCVVWRVLCGVWRVACGVCFHPRVTGASKGCGFAIYSKRESAQNAILALNGKFEMTGCKAPMIVQYADTRKCSVAPVCEGGPL